MKRLEKKEATNKIVENERSTRRCIAIDHETWKTMRLLCVELNMTTTQFVNKAIKRDLKRREGSK